MSQLKTAGAVFQTCFIPYSKPLLHVLSVFSRNVMVKPMKAPCLGPLGNAKKLVGIFFGSKRHQLRQPTPTFKDISVYCIGSQQWPPTFKQVSHLGIHFLSLGTKKMMLKKCLYTHTHTLQLMASQRHRPLQLHHFQATPCC